LTHIPFIGRFFERAMAKSFASFVNAFLRGDDAAGGAVHLSRPMAQSVWVLAAINKVVQPITAVDLYFSDLDEQEIEDPSLEAFWTAPALNADGTRMDCTEFVESLCSWLLLKGEYFLILDESWSVPFPEVEQFGGFTPLIVARPDRMRHVMRAGELAGWEYTDAANRKTELRTDQVVHRKLFNPYDPWRGLGPMEAAAIAAGADYASGVFAKNVAENNGDQGVFVIAKNGLPDDPQREQIIAQLREKRAAQQRGVFRPIFLTGDITVEDPKVKAVDAAFVAQRQEARREIAIAFGVPPSFFDPVASYSIGSASDRFVLIEETCKPLGKKVCAGVTAVAQRQMGIPLRAELDWDDHSVMQAVRRERLDSAVKLWNLGMPMKQVNDYLSLDMDPFPGWDVGYLPFSVAPANALEDPAASAEFSEDVTPETEPDEAIEEMVRTLKADPGETFQRARDPKQVAQWRTLMGKRRATIKAYQSRFNRELLKARGEVLSKLAKAKMLRALDPAHKAVAADFLFNLEGFKNGVLVSLRNVAKAGLQTAGEQLFAEVGKDDPFKYPDARALEFLAARDNRLSGVADDVYSQIKATLEEGINDGDSIATMESKLRAKFNDLGRDRARTIAMTETGAVYGAAREEAMKQAGIQYKQWLTSGNSNVRAAHAAANGQTVPVDEPFEVDGESLMHPGDPNGSPGNVINCHCVSVAVANPNE
jgi:SPP1 gp7 family putative phage head morphogenesis protein